MIRIFFLAALSLLIFTSCEDPTQESEMQSLFDDETLVKIYDAAHRGDTAALYLHSESETAAYRMAYARLMGSVLPEAAPEALEDLLMDPIPYVRLYAAFAVGQIGNEKSLPALEKAFKKATIPEIKAEFLEAIGKCADENAMSFLVTYNPNTAIDESGKMWGIYRGMLKGQLMKEQLEIVVAHLKSREEETRLAAANVLARQKDFDLSPFAEELYQKAQAETNPEIKGTLGYALAKTEYAEKYALDVLNSEDSPLLRAIGLLVLPNPEDHLIRIENELISESPWVAMSAAKRLAEVDSFVPSPTTIGAARTTSIPEVSSVIALALLRSDAEKGKEFYNRSRARLGNPVKQSVLLSVWAEFPNGIDSLSAYLFDDGPLGTAATTVFLK
ncbi:MAG TPA: HEAT repeat domain-containing protein, partial [Cryomorphaceae bacterium]|nr:HEAT repeat domain-containing protein [Cryomorphaceae bacterium]